MAADLRQVQAGRSRVGVGQDEPGGDLALWADRAEQVGPGVAAVARRPGAGAATRPDPGQRALLADAGLVLKPDLDRLAAGVLGQCLRRQLGEAFLKASWAASSALGGFGRTDSRAKPSRCSSLPTVRSCRWTPKRASIRARRSTRRQRTTQSRSGSGPCAPTGAGRGAGRRARQRYSGAPSLAGSAGPCRRAAPLACARPRPAPAPGRASAARPPRPGTASPPAAARRRLARAA